MSLVLSTPQFSSFLYKAVTSQIKAPASQVFTVYMYDHSLAYDVGFQFIVPRLSCLSSYKEKRIRRKKSCVLLTCRTREDTL